MKRFALILACAVSLYPATRGFAQGTTTSTALTTVQSPTPLGQSVIMTATVSPSTATGSVTFYDGPEFLGTGSLSAGVATLSTPLLEAGPHPLTGRYTGDAADLPSISPVFTQVVNASVGGAFFPVTAYPAGPGARGVAAGDFNGDQRVDFAVANASSGIISVSLGNGDGTFSAPRNYTVGTSPTSIAVADFNSDGLADLIVTNQGSNNLSLLLGNGDGTFQAAITIPAPGGPASVVVGDFNSDGKADLAVANNGTNNISIFAGNGDGTFQSPSQIGAPTAPVFLALADMNGDGKADLLCASSGQSSIAVLVGLGDGTFLAALNYSTVAPISSIATGDFNGDGKVDVAVAIPSGNDVGVLLGNGNGSLQPVTLLPAGLTPQSVTVADLNGDANLDIVAAGNGNDSVNILIGNGNGTFQAAYSFAAGHLPTSVAAGDFNQDGVTDLAISESTADGQNGSLGVLLGGIAALSAPFGAESAPIGSAYPNNLSLTVTAAGVPVSGANVTFAVQPSSGASGLFSTSGTTAMVTTNSSGVAAAPILTANGLSGPFSVVATAAGMSITFSLTNTASPCTFAVSASTLFFDSSAGSTSVTVTPSGLTCTWGDSSTTPWVSLSPVSGSGIGAVNLSVAANSTGSDRTASVSIAGQTISISQASTAQLFSDVPPSVYYFDAVNLLAQKQITAGCTPTTFCPTDLITRAQTAVFIVRAVYGGDNFSYSPTPYFTDVPPSAFGFQWIQKLYELGITTGCTLTTFCPNANITRDQMAVFVIRMRYGAVTVFDYPLTPYFTDVPQSEFAFQWVQRLKEDNVTSGCSSTLYCPASPVTRGDMAIFVMRAAFNQLLPAGQSVLVSVSPSALARGASATLTITGQNTSFVQGTTVLGAVPGLLIGPVTVVSPTVLTAPVTISTSAAQQPESILVKTGSEEPVLPNGFVIQ